MRVQVSVKMALIICELYTIVVGGAYPILPRYRSLWGDKKGKSVAFMFFFLFLISDDSGRSCVRRKASFLLLGFLGLINRLSLIEFLLRIHSMRVLLRLSYLLLGSMIVVCAVALIRVRHFRWLPSFCRIWRLFLFLLLLDFLFHFELIVDDLKGNQNLCGWKRLI